MQQQMMVTVALSLALMAGVAAAASDVPQHVSETQQAPSTPSRTFGERVKILFGLGEAPQAAPAPRMVPQPPAAAEPVQTFNDVEIDLDAFSGEDLGDSD